MADSVGQQRPARLLHISVNLCGTTPGYREAHDSRSLPIAAGRHDLQARLDIGD